MASLIHRSLVTGADAASASTDAIVASVSTDVKAKTPKIVVAPKLVVAPGHVGSYVIFAATTNKDRIQSGSCASKQAATPSISTLYDSAYYSNSAHSPYM